MTDEHIIRRLDELATRLDTVEGWISQSSEIARHRPDRPDHPDANPARTDLYGPDDRQRSNPIAAVAIAAVAGLIGWALWGTLT